MNRRVSLRSKTPMPRGKPLRRVSAKTKRRNKGWPAVRALVLARDGWRCRRCGQRYPNDMLNVHHRVAKSRLGPDDPVNLLTLCAGPGSNACHEAVHASKEHPYVVRGAFNRDGVYVGSDPEFIAVFGRKAA